MSLRHVTPMVTYAVLNLPTQYITVYNKFNNNFVDLHMTFLKIRKTKGIKLTRTIESRRSGFFRKTGLILGRDQKVTLSIATFLLFIILFLASLTIQIPSSISPQSPLQISETISSNNSTNVIELPFHLAAGAYENLSYNLGNSTTANLKVYARPFSLFTKGNGTEVYSSTLSRSGTYSYFDPGPSNIVTVYLFLNTQQQKATVYLNVTITSYYPNEQNVYLLIPSMLLLLGFSIGTAAHMVYIHKNSEAYWYGLEQTGKARDPSSTRRQSIRPPLQKRRNYTTIYLFIISIVLMLSSGLGILDFIHNKTAVVLLGTVGIAFLFISIFSATVAYLIEENKG